MKVPVNQGVTLGGGARRRKWLIINGLRKKEFLQRKRLDRLPCQALVRLRVYAVTSSASAISSSRQNPTPARGSSNP